MPMFAVPRLAVSCFSASTPSLIRGSPQVGRRRPLHDAGEQQACRRPRTPTIFRRRGRDRPRGEQPHVPLTSGRTMVWAMTTMK
jgi:hypothetical protein